MKSDLMGYLCIALCAFGMLSCGPSHNTVEEEDRQGIDTERQIFIAQDIELDRIEAALKENPDLKTTAVMPIIERMREKNNDAKAITTQLLANFHPPQQIQIYSHAEMQSLLKRMHDAHTVTFWAALGAGLLAGATAIIGLARSPLAKMVPGVGTILTALDGTLAAAGTWMDKMRASGHVDVADGLASVFDAAHQNPTVAAFIDKKLGKIESGAITVHPETMIATAIAADAAADVQTLAVT